MLPGIFTDTSYKVSVNINDVVAAGHRHGLIIARVIKINPKMIRVKEFKTMKYSWESGEYNIYPSEMVRISEADAIIYILKNT